LVSDKALGNQLLSAQFFTYLLFHFFRIRQRSCENGILNEIKKAIEGFFFRKKAKLRMDTQEAIILSQQ